MYYLVYGSGADGEILGPAEILNCPNDETAIAKAMLLLSEQDLEAVQGERLVTRLQGKSA